MKPEAIPNPTFKPNTKINYDQFQKDLEEVINKHSMENGSNTPDFILAHYLVDCLKSFNKTSKAREKWYGKELKING